MHANADTRSLLRGLDLLSQSIDQKSASLKVLVESNFERFVKAKATIDNVYKEMKNRGEEPQSAGGHSRQVSRSSYRNSLGGRRPSVSSPLTPTSSGPRKKNALVKESEFGVMGIKAPLLEVSAKAEDVWGPALGGREKEEHLKIVSNYLNRYKENIELSSVVSDCIKRKDYETLVEAYNRARKFADEARETAVGLKGSSPGDDELYQILLAGRTWHDIEQQVQAFKKDIWKKLGTVNTLSKSEGISSGRAQDQHLELISLLLELGVDDNPIWVWLLSRHEYLTNKIQAVGERHRLEIEVLRRRLASKDKPTPKAIASHLKHLGKQGADRKPNVDDEPEVIELWEKISTFLHSFASQQGLLGEFLEFWQITQGFIDGKTQRALPLGVRGESQKHHKLTPKMVTDLERGAVELVDRMREHLFTFFAGMPPDDISSLLSPSLISPNSPGARVSMGEALSPTLRDPRFNFDQGNPPPPSPKKGESWEKFAFWPPWSNSISGVHYLAKMLALVGSCASDLASIGPVAVGPDQVLERLKTLVGTSRERCVTALCAAWNRDAENIRHVEDWQRSADDGDVTRMPASFSAFEDTLLTGMQKILYVSEATATQESPDIVLPPPTKLLQMVRSQYVTTLYKALSGMVENAERSLKKSQDEWSVSEDDMNASLQNGDGRKQTINAGDRNIRMLLTLNNLQALRSQVVPNLNSRFENAFSVKLTDESKTIKDVLGQIDARLFKSYTKQPIENLRRIIQAGLSAPDWAPAVGKRPTSAKPYVYEALLSLVLIHSQVSTTTASLTPQVLSFLLEQTSQQLLDAFKSRPKYSLEALMQATLDVEFVAQTLSQYTTDKASELQSSIYQELDSRTDNDARARLQSELPEMRSVLKKLREASKTEFACFKKPRRQGGGSTKPEAATTST